eukprot:TRINITY_DN13897_c1_g1_i1.p1 TRINITY_DN13897_c1_g1~~TRINITY_DN13897_c1_g1_i1.p1  ORF type:complete len:124 (-),score=0.07 TRINITY_DN13897_c1_g1_i1:432-803(-)
MPKIWGLILSSNLILIKPYQDFFLGCLHMCKLFIFITHVNFRLIFSYNEKCRNILLELLMMPMKLFPINLEFRSTPKSYIICEKLSFGSKVTGKTSLEELVGNKSLDGRRTVTIESPPAGGDA